MRSAVATAALLCAGLIPAGAAHASAKDVPNPCVAVPSSMVAHALGLKTAAGVNPVGCLQHADLLLRRRQADRVRRPDRAKKSGHAPEAQEGGGSRARDVHHVRGSTQTQITFYKGTAATGIYGVVRNFGKIRRAKLEEFAKALSAAIGSGGSGGQPTGVKIVSSP